MPPAARIGDLVLQTAPHCHAPIHPPAPVPTPVPHPALPLPIMPPGAPTVLIGKMPAARVTDMTKICTLIPCIPAGPGIIIKGSMTVLISKLPAARAGDMTNHPSCVAPIPSPVGNILPPCCVTVIIGDGGGAGGGGAGGAGAGAGGGMSPGPLGSTKVTVDPATGKMKVEVGKNIVIEGTPEFCAATLQDLARIDATPSGNKLLADIDSGKHTVTIKETTDGNSTSYTWDGVAKGTGPAGEGTGKGSDATVEYNPNRTSIGSEPWQTRPPGVGLAHELIHAQSAGDGGIDKSPAPNDSVPDPADPSKTAQTDVDEAKTTGLHPYENEPYTENKIRDDWDPKQPQRPYY